MKSSKKNRKIYIVLTYTGTILAKIIKVYTGAEFSHVSLALDENLKEMYSFGRLNPYNPFIGGFVHEGIEFGTFKRFKNTWAAIYAIDLTDSQYRLIRRIIKRMNKKRRIYKFNIIGLFASGFHLKYKRENSFYCSEFVKYIMEKAEVPLQLPELVKPNDFKTIDLLELKYRGILRDYKILNH